MSEGLFWAPPAEFALVYQGGHHDVYCNGTEHVWTSGGYAGVCPPGGIIRQGKCDCARWSGR